MNQPSEDPNPPLQPGMECEEKSGFLFSHACQQPAQLSCVRCAKPICYQHATAYQNKHLCITCSKRNQDQQNSTSDRHGYYDPYWYATSHYANYSFTDRRPGKHMASDSFVESDESVLANEDDGVWEDDMGAS